MSGNIQRKTSTTPLIQPQIDVQPQQPVVQPTVDPTLKKTPPNPGQQSAFVGDAKPGGIPGEVSLVAPNEVMARARPQVKVQNQVAPQLVNQAQVVQALGLQTIKPSDVGFQPANPPPVTDSILRNTKCQVPTPDGGSGSGKVIGFSGKGQVMVQLDAKVPGTKTVSTQDIVGTKTVGQPGNLGNIHVLGQEYKNAKLVSSNDTGVMLEFDGAQGAREKRNFDPKDIRAAVAPKVGDTVLYKMPSSGYRTVLAKGTFQGVDEKGNAKIGFESKQRIAVDPKDLKITDATGALGANVVGGPNLLPEQLLKPPKWLESALDAALDSTVCNGAKARVFIDKLQNAGYQCFVVGGAVRDLVRNLMRPEVFAELKKSDAEKAKAEGKPAKFEKYASFEQALTAEPALIREVMKDIDVVTTAPMSKVLELCPPDDKNAIRTRTDTTRQYGIVTFKGEHDAEGIDIATMRAEGMFTKRDCVFDHDIVADTKSRDFSCNMLMYDPKRKVIVDATAGGKDNKSGLADAANQRLGLANPDYVYKNDMLALRAMKFQPRGYEYDPASVGQFQTNFRSFYEFKDNPQLQEQRLNKLGSNTARIVKIGVPETMENLSKWVETQLQPSMRAMGLGDFYDANINPKNVGSTFLNRLALGRMSRYPDHWKASEITGARTEFLAQAAGLDPTKLSPGSAKALEGLAARIGSSTAGSYSALAPFLKSLNQTAQAQHGGDLGAALDAFQPKTGLKSVDSLKGPEAFLASARAHIAGPKLLELGLKLDVGAIESLVKNGSSDPQTFSGHLFFLNFQLQGVPGPHKQDIVESGVAAAQMQQKLLDSGIPVGVKLFHDGAVLLDDNDKPLAHMIREKNGDWKTVLTDGKAVQDLPAQREALGKAQGNALPKDPALLAEALRTELQRRKGA